MKKVFITIMAACFILMGCSDKTNNTPITPAVPQDIMLISSYIRPNFYNMGRISDASMLECNDLIIVAAEPKADGSLQLDTIKLYDTRGVSSLDDLITKIRGVIGFSTIELRLGVHSTTEWLEMIDDTAACRTFATNVKNMLYDYNLNGVDLDFEWATTSAAMSKYSTAITILREEIGDYYTLSIQLHPLYYAIDFGALNGVDYAFLQCYGPLPNRFPFTEYVENIQTLINYGIPTQKLVAGVPFYAVAADSSKATTTYYNLVDENLIDSTTQNRAVYDNVTYVFNGQATIAEKTVYAASQDLAGMMSWDLASDVAYTDSLSLLRAMINALKK